MSYTITLPRSIGSTTHRNEKGKRLSTKRERVHSDVLKVFRARVIRCPRGHRHSAKLKLKESRDRQQFSLSFDHCMPRFAISSTLVLIWGINVKHRHSFFVGLNKNMYTYIFILPRLDTFRHHSITYTIPAARQTRARTRVASLRRAPLPGAPQAPCGSRSTRMPPRRHCFA